MRCASILHNVAGWDWVAIGTLALAAATFYLGWENRQVVDTSREQLETARDDLSLAREQNEAVRAQTETARDALAAQTAPFLTSMPEGLVVREQKGQTALTLPPISDAGWLTVRTSGGSRESPEVSLGVPFRNVGQGLAVVRQVVFLFENQEAVGRADNPVLPTHERTRARFRGDPGHPAWHLASNVEAVGSFSVVIEYGDTSGARRGAVRIDAQYRDDRMMGWKVRQVHFGESWRQAWQAPTASTQPAF